MIQARPLLGRQPHICPFLFANEFFKTWWRPCELNSRFRCAFDNFFIQWSAFKKSLWQQIIHWVHKNGLMPWTASEKEIFLSWLCFWQIWGGLSHLFFCFVATILDSIIRAHCFVLFTMYYVCNHILFTNPTLHVFPTGLAEIIGQSSIYVEHLPPALFWCCLLFKRMMILILCVFFS